MADAIRGSLFGIGAVGILQGIHMGGTTSLISGSCNKAMQVGVQRSNVQGMPLVPSLEVHFWGSWRFRWAVTAGARAISVWALQAINQSPRPALVVKANPDVGLAADIIVEAPAGSGWVHTPNAAFVATATGVLWVELHNRIQSENAPAFFDHIVSS